MERKTLNVLDFMVFSLIIIENEKDYYNNYLIKLLLFSRTLIYLGSLFNFN